MVLSVNSFKWNIEELHFYGNVFEEKMSSVVLCILIPWSGPAQLKSLKCVSTENEKEKKTQNKVKFNKPECIFMQF